MPNFAIHPSWRQHTAHNFPHATNSTPHRANKLMTTPLTGNTPPTCNRFPLPTQPQHKFSARSRRDQLLPRQSGPHTLPHRTTCAGSPHRLERRVLGCVYYHAIGTCSPLTRLTQHTQGTYVTALKRESPHVGIRLPEARGLSECGTKRALTPLWVMGLQGTHQPGMATEKPARQHTAIERNCWPARPEHTHCVGRTQSVAFSGPVEAA